MNAQREQTAGGKCYYWQGLIPQIVVDNRIVVDERLIRMLEGVDCRRTCRFFQPGV